MPFVASSAALAVVSRHQTGVLPVRDDAVNPISSGTGKSPQSLLLKVQNRHKWLKARLKTEMNPSILTIQRHSFAFAHVKRPDRRPPSTESVNSFHGGARAMGRPCMYMYAVPGTPYALSARHVYRIRPDAGHLLALIFSGSRVTMAFVTIQPHPWF